MAGAAGIEAIGVVVHGHGEGADVRDVIVGKAHELSVMGWVRSESDGSVRIHAEGTPEALAELISFLHDRGSPGEIAVEVESVAHEGHEQFAIRGVSAGAFVIQEHVASTHHFDLRLEVDGVMRSWAVPKGPSLDPAVKRFAVEASDHAPADNAFEGKRGAGAVIVWDQGTYEQGGRVPWPEALKRGHAVFVLHGQKLRGGFALQRTRPGPKAGWLLVKRRDDEARAGSDIVAERPDSVVSGHTLADVQS